MIFDVLWYLLHLHHYSRGCARGLRGEKEREVPEKYLKSSNDCVPIDVVLSPPVASELL